MFRLRINETFGPLLKIMIIMMSDLTTFLVFWFIVLISMTAFAFVIFHQITNFQENFFSILLKLFEWSLGAFDDTIFDENYPNPKSNINFSEHFVGRTFLFIVLLVNLVLILNLLIAILSLTYTVYSDKKKGLFYEDLVAKFPSMEFDDRYGSVCCAPPVLNLFLIILWPITLLPFFNEK